MILKNKQKIKTGFTLIEAMIVIFIMAVVGVAISNFQRDVFSTNKFLSGRLTEQDEARRALKTVTAEIRPLSPSSIGSYPIAQASPTSFTFYSDIDADALKEQIRYFLDGTTLKKGVIKPSGSPLTYNPANEQITELIHYVVNGATPVFSYYDKNYDGTTPSLSQPIDILAVRLVQVTIIVNQDPSRAGPITLTTQVSMRNLKDNL
jgi:prepilin-type N-terminal cleavage/methylation domain-containing protein